MGSLSQIKWGEAASTVNRNSALWNHPTRRGHAWLDSAMTAPTEGTGSSGGAVGSSAGSTVAGNTAGQCSTLTNLPLSWNMIPWSGRSSRSRPLTARRRLIKEKHPTSRMHPTLSAEPQLDRFISDSQRDMGMRESNVVGWNVRVSLPVSPEGIMIEDEPWNPQNSQRQISNTDAHPVDGSPNQNAALLSELDRLGTEGVNLTKGR